jgi:putative endonuclease
VTVKAVRGFESHPFRMFYIYVLWSNKLEKRYIGYTENIEKRLKEHNSGKTPFTKSGKPWSLIYQESYSDKTLAIKREMFLKSGQGRKFLDDELQKAVRGFSAEG